MIRAAAGGLLFLGLTLALALASATGDSARGERLFQRCYACHSVAEGEHGLSGPSLRCLLGRRAGTLPGFAFSPAMTEAGTGKALIWTRATLDAFLVDPQRLVPGTVMLIPSLTAPEDRRDLIDYLEQIRPCPAG